MSIEKDKMISGKLYDASDPVLSKERTFAKELIRKYNITGKNKTAKRQKMLSKLFQKDLSQIKDSVWIEPPFFCDYGYNIKLKGKFYANHNCIILDVCHVEFGDNILMGPNVQIYTATHPMSPQARLSVQELGKPISIGNNVWIGGSAVICPGVTIGDNCVIGAGSVVTRDIPANTFAAGNPCRVIKNI